MDSINRWQDRLETAVGVWLCIAPWALSLPEAAAWCAIVVGVFVIVLSVEDIFLPNQIEEWGNAILGAGLMISPWAWGYSTHMAATVNAFISGFLVSGFAFWALERLYMRYEESHRASHS
ncbi:MAG TPA: SPW repeat protein [Noviherbaspirillum sp.]|nr:SPW repeat protein [Noviherbaspirillum sp.]